MSSVVRGNLASDPGSTGDGHRNPLLVEVPGGERLVVPLSNTSRVQDLHSEALRRAGRRGFTGTLSTTAIRTTGAQTAILDHEDFVSDVIEATQDNTFSLVEAPTIASPFSSVSSATYVPFDSATLADCRHTVFVRWITTTDAMSFGQLSMVPTDAEGFSSRTTLDTLRQQAVLRLCNEQRAGICIHSTAVRLWLKECELYAHGNLHTLSDFNLVGSMSKPLDVFVQLLGSRMPRTWNQLSDLGSRSPFDAWGVNVSRHGLSTFVSSLAILMREIERGAAELERVLDLVFRLTGFPPATIAFRQLYESGAGPHSYSVPALLLLMDVFGNLCSLGVPDWIAKTRKSKLEGSRQLLFWLGHASSIDHGRPRLTDTYEVQIRSVSRDMSRQDALDSAAFNNVELIEADGRTLAASLDTPNPDGVLARRITLALARSREVGVRYSLCFRPSTGEWQNMLDIPRFQPPAPGAFEFLVANTNSSPFKIKDPLTLRSCLNAELPILTLSPTGLVSLYNQRDRACADREFYTYNAIDKDVVMQGDNPGEFISQKLVPIIEQRKLEGTWILDAWAGWSERSEGHAPPDESIVFCVDRSGSMAGDVVHGWCPRRDTIAQSINRLGEVKMFFEQLSTRLFSYRLHTSVGLVTFNGSIDVSQRLSLVQADFCRSLYGIKSSGRTAIFDAIEKAKDMLLEQRQRFPNTKLRILVLTDGEDNESKVDKLSLANHLHDERIVLDAIVLGTSNTTDLFKFCRATGGYAFSPPTQQVFFQTFLLENVLDIRTRPGDVPRDRPDGDWGSFKPKKNDMKDCFSFPKIKEHANSRDYFVDLAQAHRFLRSLSRSASGAGSAAPSSNSSLSSWARVPGSLVGSVSSHTTGRSLLSGSIATSSGSTSRVLMLEVKAVIEDPHAYMDVYVSQRNMGFWKVVFQGPPGTPYEGGTFLLYVDIGHDYPRVPPDVRFITSILHPSISKHGRICHPIFDVEWNPCFTVRNILDQIYGLLMTLESDSAVDPLSTLHFYTDPAEGRRQVQEYIQRFAKQTREEHRHEILDDNASETSAMESCSTTFSTASSATITNNVSGVTIRADSNGPSPRASRPPPLLGPRGGGAGSVQGSVGLTVRNLLRHHGGSRDGSTGGGVDQSRPRSSGRRQEFFRRLSRLTRDEGRSASQSSPPSNPPQTS
ncbi:uncharacterized protein MKZ38_003471 [Zalerion maritima]|uniref:Uncharacterized protein n=1 Tax=Zalerion maritima TaxID=339359 RepID=A0AAD5WUL1_9PEZI|nr:uncharacterized protein MKZ38_003471 [Zalerion maritima]